MGINTPQPGNNPINSILNDENLKNDFIEQMQLITKETGITLNINTTNQHVAWMIPGQKGVYFNPIFTLNLMKKIAKEREGELGIKSSFKFDIKHLSVVVLHEINHMINHTDLKRSDKTIEFDGKKMRMDEYEKALYEKYGQDFRDFENVFEDIDVNNLATKIQAPIYETPKKEIYQNICTPDSDFSQEPLHQQLGQAALRESMIEDEKCIVDPTIRNILDYIDNDGGLLETIRDPQLKYDEQLPAIAKLYEEYYLPLKKETEKRGQQQNQQQNQNSNSEEQNSSKSGQQTPHVSPMSLPHIFDDLESQHEEMQQNEKNENTKSKENEGGKNKENGKSDQQKQKLNKLKDKIKDVLKGKSNKSKEKNDTLNQLEQALNGQNEKEEKSNTGQDTKKENQEISDELMKQIEDFIEMQEKEKNKTPEDRQMEESIKKERGTNNKNKIEQIKRQLKQQEEIFKRIKQIKDKEGNSVYNKITEEIFKKIVNFRKYRSIYEKSPQPFSGGGQFSPHALVGGIMDWKNGDDDPRIMQQEKIEEKEKKKAGSFSITFILDGSGSMEGEKNLQQKLSTLIMLYALQQINDNLKSDEYSNMEKFAVESQVMMFKGSGEVETFKQRGKDLTRKDIIEITDGLNYCDGDTNAADAIEEYFNQISKPFNNMSNEDYDERKEKVKSEEKKEIVFILSDGDFNSGGNPEGYIKKMRDMGIIVCGIGITNEGRNITNYFGKKTDDPEKDKQGFGIICENANELGTTLNDLLIHHLQDPMIIGE